MLNSLFRLGALKYVPVGLSFLVVLVAIIVAFSSVAVDIERLDWVPVDASLANPEVFEDWDDDSTWWVARAQVRWRYDDVPHVSPEDEPWEQTFDTEAAARDAIASGTTTVWIDPTAPHQYHDTRTTMAHVIGGYVNLAGFVVLFLLMAARVRKWRHWVARTQQWIRQESPALKLEAFENERGELVIAQVRPLDGWLAGLFLPLFPTLFFGVGLIGFVSFDGWESLLALIFVAVGAGIGYLLVSQVFRCDVLEFGDDALKYERQRFVGSEQAEFKRSTIRHIVTRENEDSSGPSTWDVVVKASRALEVYDGGNETDARWLTKALSGWAGVPSSSETD